MRKELENIYENLYDSYPNRRGYYPDDILSANRSEVPVNFREDITSDIAKIIGRAIENQNNMPYQERLEITAHSILTAVDQIYSTLAIASIKLWNT